MSKDQGYGLVIFLVSVIAGIIYLVAFFGPSLGLPAYWRDWAVGIPVLLFVLLVLVISAWIGWTMVTTPPPAPLEPVDAEKPPNASEKSDTAPKT